jgi:hypothetical protein
LARVRIRERLLFFNPQYLPAGRLNWGDLIQPPVSLPTADLRSPDGTAFDAQALAGKWALVYLDAAQCGERCLQRLRDLRRIYLALGERRQGVERLLILVDPPSKTSLDNLEQDFDGMRIALADPAALALLTSSRLGRARALNRAYILDPMGRLMMRYGPNAPARDTLADMERLLRASGGWVKGVQSGSE